MRRIGSVPGPSSTWRLLLVVSSIAIVGCASVAPLPEHYEAPEVLPVEIANRFCYVAAPMAETITLEDERDSYRIFSASIEPGRQGFEDDSPVTFEYYEQESKHPAPVIIVLPILNGQKHVVRPFATYFADNGYAVVIVDNVQRRTLLEDLINPEPAIQLTIMRHRRILDWIELQPGLDINRVGVFGASLGGFNALFLAATDDRIRAVAAALVGGDLPHVLTQSNERRIEEAVGRAKDTLSLDDEGMETYLRQHIQTDPMSLAPYINAQQMLMVMAKFDSAVPFENQEALRAAIGDPEAITLPTGHTTAAAYLFYLRTKMLEFFDLKLSDESGFARTVSLPPQKCRVIASE